MPFRFKEMKEGSYVWDGKKRTFQEARSEAQKAHPGCNVLEPVEVYHGCRFHVLVKGQKVAAIDFIKDSYAAYKGAEPGLELPKLICKRCNHRWTPRNGAKLPKVCPKCKSPYWDHERTEDRRERLARRCNRGRRGTW